MGAQNLNFAFKFPQNWKFLAPNFVFLDENFWIRIFFRQTAI